MNFVKLLFMSSASAPQKKGFFHKRWVLVCGGILLLLPILFMFAVYGVKSYLVDWLEQNGADSAGIEKLVINPFLGRITVGDLDVQVNGTSLLKNAKMVVNLGFGALFKKNIKVQSALYSGLVVDLEQFADGRWRIGSYTVDATDQSNTSNTEKVAETAEETVPSWAFLADEVDLVDCVVMVKTPELDLKLMIEKAELRKFTTREGTEGATFSLVGTLEGEQVEIELSHLQVIPSLSIEGDVKVSRFQLAELAVLLQDVLPVFAGDIGLDGNMTFRTGEETKMLINYKGDIEARNADIGSESFATRAANLRWQGTVHYESAKDKLMVVTTDGLLAAREYRLHVPEADFTTEEAAIELQGKNTVTITDTVSVENNGSLLIEKAVVELPGSEVSEERLYWEGAVIYDSNRAGAGQYVETKGVLQSGPLSVISGEETEKISVHSTNLRWQGDVVYGQEEGGQNSYVLLAGKLEGKEIATTLAGPGLTLEQGNLVFDTDVTLNFADTFDIKGTSSLVLGDFLFAGGVEDPTVGLEKLEIAGLVGVGEKHLRLNQLTSAGLTVALAGTLPMDISVPAIQLNGFETPDLATFDIASITLEKPQITATHNKEELLRLGEVEAAGLHLEASGQVAADTLSLADLTFLGSGEESGGKPFLTLGGANISGIEWAGKKGFTGKSLTFDNLITTLIRDKEGELNVTQQLLAMQVRAAAEGNVVEEVVEEEDKKGKDAPIRLGEVVVTGKSHVKFEDYTLAVPYTTDLAINNMQLQDLDSTKPEAKSPFVLDAVFEDRAPFNVTGDISPFLQPVALHLDLKLKNYPLSRLSAYTVQSVGTALASGQLELQTKLDLENNTLDMKNSVVFKKLKTKTISPDLEAELNNQLPIPLNTALSILRDSDKNISLDVPLSGPVSHLNVGISDVLITALSKAIVPAASGYLMYTLGPYGALAYVGMKVGEKILKVELPPVDFVPGEVALSDENKKYLEKIAEILKGRPETDIQLCPQVVSWEFMDEEQIAEVQKAYVEVVEKDRDKLIEIGQQRAKAVQNYLVSTHELDISRLLICDTLVVTRKDDKPLIMLNL